MRWEERYSPSEMIYVEVTSSGVRIWLNSNPADVWSFREVLDGAIDGEIGGVFGSEVLEEIKAEARRLTS
jgi:hypothetical protein